MPQHLVLGLAFASFDALIAGLPAVSIWTG